MKICLFGKNLTNLILSQVLIKKGISVHLYHQKKNKLAKINYNRTIGLSFENIKFLKKYDVDIEKIGQKISKIFLYKNDSKETFLISHSQLIKYFEVPFLHHPLRLTQKHDSKVLHQLHLRLR